MVIDSHCHVLPPGFSHRRAELLVRDVTFAALFSRAGAPLATAEALIDAMDRAGVSRAVAVGMGWNGRALAEEVNDYNIESVARYPARLTGFCSVNPAWGDAAVAEVERCAAAGLRGVGELHPDTQGFDITDKSILAPLMDVARRLGLPVLVHSSEPVGHQYPGKGQTTPGKLYRFVENFPDNTIIGAHWGGGLPFFALMPEVPKVIENVYFDMAASPFLYRPEVIATVAGLVGAGKILFATDYPLIQPQRLLRQVKESGLNSAAREAILGGNAARLLGL
jgi:predicted TIM-barrel fold metal-dependent hydrolase